MTWLMMIFFAFVILISIIIIVIKIEITTTYLNSPSWVTVVDTPGFGNTLQEEVILRIFDKSLFSSS